jgi:basic amino acid/polyamine antiporter, APA family
MAEEGLAFRWLGRAHAKFRTPYLAIALQAIWSCALVATGTYRVLFTRVVYTEWIFFALMTLGLMRLRRRKDYAPAYRAWGASVVPVVFAASALGVAGIQIAADPWQAASGLGLVVLGLPVYYLFIRPHAHR